jgi:hypothetical protein
MQSLLAALRAELEALESELAADPRVRKATIIFELLQMYEVLPAFPNRSDSSRGCAPCPSPVVKPLLSFRRIRSIIQTIVREKGTATLARARLAELARDRRPSAPPAWLERQTTSSAASTGDHVPEAPLSRITSEVASKPALAVS